MDTLRRAGCVFAEEEAAILLESVGHAAGSGGAVDSDGAGWGDAAGSALEDRVARRVAGEPLEQIVGWVDFAGLRLRTLPGVFVPRQRTQLLAEHTVRAIEQMPRRQTIGGRPGGPDIEPQSSLRIAESATPVVVEAFCGVGPVGSYVAASVPEVCLHLGDTDVSAVGCAVDNARTLSRLDSAAGVSVRGHRLDCLVGLPDELRQGVDIIAAVPPYVPTTAVDFLPREAVDFEPATALFGGTDGLDLVCRLISEAGEWLAADGVLLIELGREQADDAIAYAAARGLDAFGHLGESEDAPDDGHPDDAPDGCFGEGEGEDDPDGHTVVLELRRAS